MSPRFPLPPFLNQRLRFHAPPPNIILQIRDIRYIPNPPAPNLPRQPLQKAKHTTLRHDIHIILPFPTFPPPNPTTPITHPPMLPRLRRRLIPIQQAIQLIIPPLALIPLPIVVEIEREILPPAPPRPPAVLVVRLALPLLLPEVVPEGEAGLAGGFEAGAQGGEAGRDVVFGEGEEGGLGREVGGFDVLGYLVEGLPDAGVGGAHHFWDRGGMG